MYKVDEEKKIGDLELTSYRFGIPTTGTLS